MADQPKRTRSRRRRSDLGVWRWLFTATAMAMAGAPGRAQAPSAPSAPIRWGEFSGRAEFHVIDDNAVLTFRMPDGNVVPVRIINDITDALAVLGDRRLAFARPALLAWAGPDLTLLRDRMVARAKAGVDIGLMMTAPKQQGAERWTGESSLSAKLAYAQALKRSGHAEEAVTFLRAQIDAEPKTIARSYARVFLTIRRAGILFDLQREDEAIALLTATSADTGLSPAFRLNADVNLAHLLAQKGRSAEALRVVDRAWEAFGAEDTNASEALKVPESEANFAAIKACALTGVGRKAEALALLDSIVVKPPEGSEIPIGTTARIMALTCMRDASALAEIFAAQLADTAPAATIFATIQPVGAYPPDTDFMLRVLDQPVLRVAVARRAFVLDPHVAPYRGAWAPFALLQDGVVEASR